MTDHDARPRSPRPASGPGRPVAPRALARPFARVAPAWSTARRAGARALSWLGDVGRVRVPPRRLGRWVLVALAVLLPSLLWGVTTASTQGSLGPHTARYDVTLDGSVTVDLGPLGTVVIDSPLPLGLGARVVVQEIPAEVTAIDAATSLESLGRAVEGYVAFFNGPEATVELAVRGLVTDALQRTALAAALLTLLVVAVRAAVGRERRAELADAWRPRRAAVLGGATVVLLVATTVVGSDVLGSPGDDERTASAVFDGTPLEGARITGRLAGVVDTYGGYAVDAWRENEAFYAAANDAVRSAWRARQESDQRLLSTRLAADEDGEAPITAVVVSDLHCNVGMADVISSVLELSEATILINAGDTTVNGTAVESYCVETFADAVPDGVTTVVSNGNHDGPDTTEQELSAGWHVLDGEVVELDGLRILGDGDPRATRIGSGTSLVGDETVAELSARMAEVACAPDADVDLLLVHDPVVGDETLRRGCAPAQVSGHYHQRIGPVRFGLGTRYTSTSTAGARLGQPTVGPLSGVAELTVLRFDPETHKVLDYRLVRVLPDASATVTVALQWPAEPPRRTPDLPLR
ncbi:metallophosphoesterase family protein [Actinotalea fermentans]|nr:metallophosphoesterase [Actinotalea fermentans]